MKAIISLFGNEVQPQNVENTDNRLHSLARLKIMKKHARLVKLT